MTTTNLTLGAEPGWRTVHATQPQPAAPDPAAARVYCLGKISKSDWRHRLFPDLRGAGEWAERDEAEPEDPPRRGRFVYGGPYFLACDHGCGHGAGGHGILGPNIEACTGTSHRFSRRQVVTLCQQWICFADVIFAWVDRTDVYGSLWELGFARRHGVPVYFAEPFDVSPEQDRELWFARESADVAFRAADALQAFARFSAAYAKSPPPPPPVAGEVVVGRSDAGLYVLARSIDELEELAGTGVLTEVVHRMRCDDPEQAITTLSAFFAAKRAARRWFALAPMDVAFIKGIETFRPR